MKHPLPKGCVCDPFDEEWNGNQRRAVCTTPIFTVHAGLEPRADDACGRCEHDRACHAQGNAKQDSNPVDVSQTILLGSELMASTFNQFNQIFGVKQ